MHETFSITTNGQGLYEFTRQIEAWVMAEQVDDALLTLFCRHTSCSLIIQENADPDVQRDLNAFFRQLVPPSDDPSMRWVRHTIEGPDDMPAHIKAALNQTSLSIPVISGRAQLGTWQGVYLFEHRDAPHTRQVITMLSG